MMREIRKAPMKSVIKRSVIFAVIVCAAGVSYAQTSEREQPAVIYKAIENYLRTQTAGLPGTVTYTVGTIDPRVVLAPCPALEAFLPAGARLWGPTSIGVRCSGASPWSIYVPAQVRVTNDYAVTARPLAQGQVLTATDVLMQHGDITQLPTSIVTDPQTAFGKTLAAGLAAGQPLRFDLLRASLVVQQGQSVKLQSVGNGFTVSAEGRALNNAAEGQVAQVRTSSGQTVSGIAREGGVVEVRF
jgi:flagella basal body P-ring formation protein FlgA